MNLNKITDKLKIYHYVLKAPKTYLFVCLVLSLIAFYFAKRLHIGDLYSGMLPQNSESVEAIDYYKKYFGEMGYLVLVIEGSSLEKAKEFSEQFAHEIEALPNVHYARGDKDVTYFVERRWLFIELKDLLAMEERITRALELQAQGVSFLFNDLMDFADKKDLPDLEFKDILKKYEKQWGAFTKINREEDSHEDFTLLWVKAKGPLGGLSDKRDFIQNIKNLEKKIKKEGHFEGVEVGYTGSYQTSIESIDFLRKEVYWVSILVTFLLAVSIYFYFRKLRAILFICLPIFVGVLWTGGLISFFFGELNLLTSFAATILAGLGSDYGIYLLYRFYQERKDGKNFEECCQATFGNTGRATYLSMLTTIVAFLGLVFSDFNVLIEFGIVGALGLVITYIATMVMMPCLLVLLESSPKKTAIPALSWTVKAGDTSRFKRLILEPKKHWGVLTFVGVLCFLGGITLPTQSRVRFTESLSTTSIPSNQLYERVSSSIGATLNPTVLMVKEPYQEAQLVEDLTRLLENSSGSPLVYDNIVGFSRFVPEKQDEKRDVLQQIKIKYEKIRLPLTQKRKTFISSLESSFKSEPIKLTNLPHQLKRLFESPYEKGVYLAYLFPSFPRVSEDAMKRYQKGVTALKEETSVDFLAADGSFLIADALKLIEKKAPQGLIILFVFFMAVLLIVIRPMTTALLIMVHLIGAIVILSGVSWLFGIKLNILNIATIPVILGTGIDCFIHFGLRLQEKRSITKTLQNEILPMSLACLSSIVGFGGLLLTSNPALRSVGWVTVIGLIIMFLLCSLVFSRCLFFEKKQQWS